MLSYQFSIKTLFPGIIRNDYIRSGNESHLRGRVFLKNSWRVTMYKVRFTKLILYVYLPLDTNSITCNGLVGSWFSSRMLRESRITDPGHCSQQIYVKQRPKYINGGILGTMGHPKERKFYGGGDFVRKSGFRCFSSVSDINEQSCVGLKELMKINKNNVNFINDKLIHLAADTSVIIQAYGIIKNKVNDMTPESSLTALDKNDLDGVVAISQQLKAGKYKFKPARGVYISKPENKGKRLLTISSFRDKVVQQVVYLILNAIYDYSFLDSSHGFRPGRSVHTALKGVKFKFQGVKWCIKTSLENNFSSIDHKILLTILSRRISCSKFLALLKKSIKAGYIEDKNFVASNKGLLLESIISPILNNIYLHQLDLFVFNLVESFNKGKNRRKSSDFRRIQYQQGILTENHLKRRMRKEMWKVNSKDPFDPNFRRLYYIRYVNDFIVGVVGSRKDTTEIRNKIDSFLNNELKLISSHTKTSIIHFSKDFIFFLDTFIKGTWERTKKVITIKKKLGTSKKVRMTSRVVLNAPIKLVFEKAVLSGFFKVCHGRFIPTSVGRCINLDHSDILRYYNSVIRGVLNYYSFANNRKSLGSFVHGLKHSCARTLALKYKLRFASKVYKKFGSNLRSPDGSVELFIPNTFKAIKEFSNCNVSNIDSIIFRNWNNKFTKSNLLKTCIICGSSSHIQMHHVRKIKDLRHKAKEGKKDFFTLQMAAINRKQVPLCSSHHKALHNNILSPEEFEIFRSNVKSF